MISLRAVARTDGDALHAIFTEPGVRRYLFDDTALTREDTQRHVNAACSHDAWVIVDGGQILGLVSLRPSGADRELIVAVSERHWGSGIAFTAAQAAMRHGFDVLKLPRILAAVDLPNQRSHRLMERLGFVLTGEVEGPKHRLRTYQAINPATSSTSANRSRL
jgi:[ribosomal protein S5]-alanine N-acetyltransferase